MNPASTPVEALDETASTPPLRHRRKQQTEREVIRAALELFESKGYEATTVEEIMDAVGASPRTFYRYFASKEDVVFFDMQPAADQVREALANRPKDVSVVRCICEFFFEDAIALEASPDRDLFDMRVRVVNATPSLIVRFHQFEMALLDVLEEAITLQRGRRRRDDLEPRYIAGAILGSIVAIKSAGHTTRELARRLNVLLDLLNEDLGPRLR